MAFIVLSPNSNAPIERPSPSFPARVGGAIKKTVVDLAESYVSPYVNAVDFWTGDSKPVDIPVSKPYEGWRSGREHASLSICGVPLPDGVIMTHCQGGSSIAYQATPLQEELKHSSRIELQQMTYRDANGKTQPGLRFVIKSDKGGTALLDADIRTKANSRAVHDKVQQIGSAPDSQRGAIVTMNEESVLRSKILADELAQRDAILNDESVRRATQRLRKVHIGESNPRTVELRFTVTDVISGSHILLADRFKVLRNLYRMFCQNPSLENEGNASVSDDNIWLTTAAKATASATKGRLIKVSSHGIDAYGVDIWATTKFIHQEVPDTDLIFVRVVLTEYESIFKTEHPEPVAAASTVSAKPVAATPAAPSKPSYSPTGGWATPSDWSAP